MHQASIEAARGVPVAQARRGPRGLATSPTLMSSQRHQGGVHGERPHVPTVQARIKPHRTVTSSTLVLSRWSRAGLLKGRPTWPRGAWRRRTCALRREGTDAHIVAASRLKTRFPSPSRLHRLHCEATKASCRVHQSDLPLTSSRSVDVSFRRLQSRSIDVAATPHGTTSTAGRTSIYSNLMGGARST